MDIKPEINITDKGKNQIFICQTVSCRVSSLLCYSWEKFELFKLRYDGYNLATVFTREMNADFKKLY